MIDREKVIQGLQRASRLAWNGEHCNIMDADDALDVMYAISDALALLKEQDEPVLTEELIKKVELAMIAEGQQDKKFKWGEVIKYSPSEVGEILRKHGAKRAVKWDD